MARHMAGCRPVSHCRIARFAPQLAFDPSSLAWSWAGVSGALTPIKQSRVISGLSCSSLQPSVPSGRSGILKNLSALDKDRVSGAGSRDAGRAVSLKCQTCRSFCSHAQCMADVNVSLQNDPSTAWKSTSHPRSHLVSAFESWTVMPTLSGSTVPNSARTPRGSRTVRAR